MLIVATYANSLPNSFHFDDRHVIENNAYIRSLGNAPRFFTDAHTFSALPSNATYRPVVSLSLAIDYAIGKGLQQRQFHVTQIALLLLVFLLLEALFREILTAAAFENAGILALTAATWFAVHTANSETMNLISARSELLAAIGVVGSLLLFAGSPFARKSQLHLVPMVVGILAKATAAIYAPLLALYLMLFDDVEPRGTRIRRFLPALVAAAAMLLFISRMNAPEWTSGGGAWLSYVRTEAWITMHYLRLFLLPAGLSADSDLALIGQWYDTRVIIGLIGIMALILAAIRLSRERSTRPIAFGLWWFLLTILPTALFPLAEVESEHRAFLPYMGLALAATCAAQILLLRIMPSTRAFRITTAILVVGVVGGNALGTFERNKTWRTEETLWLDVTEKSPGNGRALMNYGLTQMEKGELRRAREYFERAALLTPNYSTLEINRGIVLGALGENVGAERHLRRALALHDDADSRFFYGRWLMENGRAVEAIAHLERAVSLSPASINPRRMLILLYVAAGETQRLQRLATDTRSIDAGDALASRYAAWPPAFSPGSTDGSFFQEGLSATQRGRHLDAAVAYRNTVVLNARSADAWNNLGWELAALGLRSQAVDAYRTTLIIDPAYERARNNLTLLLRQ